MDCVYHHKRWRGEIQRLLNALRGSLLSNQHIKLFSKAVCTCRGDPPSSFPVACLSELKAWMRDNVSSLELEKANPCLTEILNAAESNTSPYSDSLLRVLSLVKAATEGDFSSLTPPTQAGNHPVKPVPTVSFVLPLPSHFLGIFFGSGGSHIKSLCQEFGVKIHFEDVEKQSSNKSKHLTGDSVKVTVAGEVGKKVNFSGVQESLLARAELVNKKREQHQENVATYIKVRSQRRFLARFKAKASVSKGSGASSITNPKEAAVEHFERKQQHGNSKSSSSDKKPTSSVLTDGHCFHCLTVYQPGCTEDGACTHHSGFLVPLKKAVGDKKSQWSCCSLATVEQHPSHNLHLSTGCTKGRHLWRPGKPSNKGTKEPTGRNQSDFSLN